VKLGFVIQNQGPDSAQAVARLGPVVEDLGYDSVWLTDHVVGVSGYAERGYTPYWLELLSGLSFIAAQTSRIRLGTSILVLPNRDPVYTAKVLSTIDNLSGGRLNLGIGTGWSRGEFHSLGRGHYHENRGAVTNESMKLILRCWEGGKFSWESEFFNFRNMEFDPVPVQKPHPPIFVGGPPAPPVVRRIAMFGAGWHPVFASPSELQEEWKKVNDTVGRHVEVSNRVHLPAETPESDLAKLIEGFAATGCEEFVIDLRADTADEVARLAEKAMNARQRALS